MGAGRDKSRSSKKQRQKAAAIPKPTLAPPPLDQERIARLLGASSFEPVDPGGPLVNYNRMKNKERKGK